ncbi:MAG: DNA repair protein RecO [Pseudomonadota bacterium]
MSQLTSKTTVTEALLLRRVPFSESDLVVTLYARDQGKLVSLARGARRSRRRFGAALSPFVVGEAALRERVASDLVLLERFDARRDYSLVAVSIAGMAHASYATELVEELSVPNQADPAVFDLLVELYQTVLETGPKPAVLRAFELRLLEAIGFRPSLDRCVGCGAGEEAIGRAVVLVDSVAGGVLCARCSSRRIPSASFGPIPLAVWQALLDLQNVRSLAAAAQAPLRPDEIARGAREVTGSLLGCHLRRPLKSLQFIHKLKVERVHRNEIGAVESPCLPAGQ